MIIKVGSNRSCRNFEKTTLVQMMLAKTASDSYPAPRCIPLAPESAKKSISSRPLKQQLEDLLPKLLLHALRLTRSKQASEDLVQATCVRALDRLGQWQGEGRFEAWVVKIMESIWFNDLRKARQRREEELEDPDAVSSIGFENATNAKIMLITLHDRAIISSEDFSLIMKVHLYGFTYRELADEYDLPIGTLLSRVSRTMNTLRKATQQLDQEARS